MIDFNSIYIGKRKVNCPDANSFLELPPNHVCAPINGYGYVLAVFANVFDRPTLFTCVGWIVCDALGYRSAKEWIEANPEWEVKFGNLFHTAR